MPKKTSPGSKGGPPKKQRLNPQQRAQRTQQILFVVLGIIVVLSMLLALIYRY